MPLAAEASQLPARARLTQARLSLFNNTIAKNSCGNACGIQEPVAPILTPEGAEKPLRLFD
jgi:hypothetical protein